MRTIFIFLSLLIVSAVGAQDFSVVYEHNALVVKNVETSAKFYRDFLHLHPIPVPNAPEERRWFSIGDGLQLHLIEGDNSDFVPDKSRHIAFRTTDLDATIDALRKENYTFWSWQGEKNVFNVRADGIRQIYLQDPDGYWIEINDTARP